MQEPQQSLGERARWFRVGMVSATMLTPLVKRWQTLRAAERTRALWDASRVGTMWPRRRPEATPELPPLARKSNLSTGLWLAGVGVGLVAAGTIAYFVARRRMAAREEEPLELPLASQNGTDGALSMGVVEGDPVLAAAAGARAWHGGAQREAVGASPPLPESAAAEATEPEQASFVGDVRSLAYYAADDERLPAEAHRVYFATREEAESAGYHAGRGDTPAGEATP